MTDVPVNDVLPLVTVTATGGQTVFSYPFLIQATNQLEVIETLDPTGTPTVTTLVEGTDYSVAGAGVATGGTITLLAGPYPTGATAGTRYTLQRDVPIDRLSDFPFRGSFTSATVNTELDKITLILQELSRDLGRALTLRSNDPLSSIQIPAAPDRFSKALHFDSAGDAIAVTPTDASGTAVTATGSTTSRILAERFAEIVNVKDFGATGDGVTDDVAAFNAAIAALPSFGGFIFVPDGDYTATTAGSVSVGSKVVTFLAYNAELPDAMPGSWITAKPSGQTLELEGASGRPSDAFQWIDVGSHTVDDVANQQDNIFHVQGELADDAGTNDREFRALSFAMKTTHGNANASIRGIRGTVKAIGGSAKLRAIRVTAEGDSGHDGLITGVLVTATRLDGNSGAPYPAGGPGLEEAGVLVTVGPGIRSVFEAASFVAGNKERPQVAYRVKGGNQAVLPEVACFDAHGGGNGALFRSRRSDTSDDVIFSADNQARVMARSIYSGRRTIADDGFIQVTTPEAGNASGMIEVWVGNTQQSFGKAYYRVSAAAINEAYSGTSLDFTTGVLNGTTGTDGNITVSIHTDGDIYIENRLGSSKEVNWLFHASSSETGQLS